MQKVAIIAKMTMFTNRLDYTSNFPAVMRDVVDMGYKQAHHQKSPELAYTNFTKVITYDVPQIDNATDNAVLLETARASRERAWIVCQALHSGRVLIEGANPNYREDIEQAKSDTALLLNFSEETTPITVKNYLSELHDDRLRQDTRTILSEHARTNLIIGRMTILELFMAGELAEGKILTTRERQKVSAAQTDLGREGAYGYALLGNQPNLLVEIAVHAARAEKSTGGIPSSVGAAGWMMRGLSGVIQSLVQGSAEEKVDAFIIAKEFAPLLGSQESAASSIPRHP